MKFDSGSFIEIFNMLQFLLILDTLPWRPGFNPVPVHVGFVVDGMAVGQVPPPSTPIFMLAVSLHLQHSMLINLQWNLCSQTPLITNKFSEKKNVSGDERCL
jgi:hypothetical protein